MRHNRRSTYLLKNKIQVKYALLTVALLLIYTIVLLAAVFVPQMWLLASESRPFPERVEAANAFLLIHSYLWPILAVVVILFGGVTILVTHRLAGPLFVIHRMISRLLEGDLSARVKLRKEDDLHDLELVVNRLAEKNELLVSVLDERFRCVAGHAAELRTINPQGSAAIASEIAAIEKILGHYTFRPKKDGTGDDRG